MFPEQFIKNLSESLGRQITEELLASFEVSPEISVRRNPCKFSEKDFTEYFGNNADGYVNWCKDAIYLKERPSFTMDPLFHSGAYYVQEASSMYVGKLFDTIKKQNMRVLDLCAAPGGKSTHLVSILTSDSLLVSNEVIRSRASILAENMVKWGFPNVIVSNNDPCDFGVFKGYFDVILADVPCSGEGMFRKDPGSVGEWSQENVRICVARQRRIVSDIWSSIKKGGFMIYSTCTFNSHENEDNIEWICKELGAEVVKTDIPQGALSSSCGAVRFIPGKTRGEGFFCALLRKLTDTQESKLPIKINKSTIKKEKCQYVSEGNIVVSKVNIVKCYPENIADEMFFIESKLRSINSGVKIAEIKGKDFIPAHALSLSNMLKKNEFISKELSYTEAIKFLRKEALDSMGIEKGYVLVGYKNIPLGFVKNIGSRTNNLYPSQWRIRVG